MALFPPPKPSSLFAASLPITQGLTKVSVFGDINERRTLKIAWPAQKGVVRYIVYASPSPIFRNKFREVPKTQTTADFQFPIIVPEDFVFYFWVSYVSPFGKEIFIQEEPCFLMNNSAFDPEEGPLSPEIRRDIANQKGSKFRVEEMRRRHLFMLQSDGEEFYLHIRRMAGQRCICLTEQVGKEGRIVPVSTDSYDQIGKDFDTAVPTPEELVDIKDSGYQTSYRCPTCFGTSIVGGYLPKIKILIRYGNLPPRLIDMKDQGLQFLHKFNSWTIWHPQLKENDLLIRISSGERFFVKDAGTSRLRKIALHQEFNAVFEDRSSPVYDVTDERVLAAVKKESSFDVGVFDWAVWS